MMRSSGGSLPLMRRWRAWQALRHQHRQQQQALLHACAPAAAAAAATPTTAATQHADVVASVAAALSRLGVQPGLQSEVCDGLLTVDLALQRKGRLIAVDITPRPPEMLPLGGGGGGGGRPDLDPAATGRPRPVAAETPARAWALAQARRQALKAHGWRYVQLPAVEFLGALGDAEEEDELVKARVLAAADDDDSEGGHVCGSGCGH